MIPLRQAGLGCILLVLLMFVTSSCSSMSFERTTETSGTFRSSGVAITLISYDLPERAIDIARENASDANLPHMVVKKARVFPYLGPLDWLLDIVGIRFAKISGTWGFAAE